MDSYTDNLYVAEDQLQALLEWVIEEQVRMDIAESADEEAETHNEFLVDLIMRLEPVVNQFDEMQAS